MSQWPIIECNQRPRQIWTKDSYKRETIPQKITSLADKRSTQLRAQIQMDVKKEEKRPKKESKEAEDKQEDEEEVGQSNWLGTSPQGCHYSEKTE